MGGPWNVLGVKLKRFGPSWNRFGRVLTSKKERVDGEKTFQIIAYVVLEIFIVSSSLLAPKMDPQNLENHEHYYGFILVLRF